MSLILLALYDDTQLAFILALRVRSDDVVQFLLEVVFTERLQLFELFHQRFRVNDYRLESFQKRGDALHEEIIHPFWQFL